MFFDLADYKNFLGGGVYQSKDRTSLEKSGCSTEHEVEKPCGRG